MYCSPSVVCDVSKAVTQIARQTTSKRRRQARRKIRIRCPSLERLDCFLVQSSSVKTWLYGFLMPMHSAMEGLSKIVASLLPAVSRRKRLGIASKRLRLVLAIKPPVYWSATYIYVPLCVYISSDPVVLVLRTSLGPVCAIARRQAGVIVHQAKAQRRKKPNIFNYRVLIQGTDKISMPHSRMHKDQRNIASE